MKINPDYWHTSCKSSATRHAQTDKGEMKIMKKILALTIAGMLIASSAGAGGSSSADQKWLQVVQKKLAAGQTHIATPAPERVTLLKQWAASNGYSIQVTRTATTYRIELAKSIAQQ